MNKIRTSINGLKCYQVNLKNKEICREWLHKYQCPLIIEEHDYGFLNTPFFYQFAGVQGGLHTDRSKHLKRVHIIIQGSVGIYLAKTYISTHINNYIWIL